MSTFGSSPSKRLEFSSWSSSLEEIVGNLDLLTEILLRLPARSLVRFKCVCRKWLYLISGPSFPPMHSRHNPKPSVCGLYLCRSYPIPLQGHSLPVITCFNTSGRNIYDYKIHDSRNGLILGIIRDNFKSEPRIMVCNLTTRKHKVFHTRELDFPLYENKYKSRLYLYFNPSISPIYKLIVIRDNIERSCYNISICASNRSFWKTRSLEAQTRWGHRLIHRFLSSDGIIYIITENWYLLQFDVETEKLSAVLMTQDSTMPADSVMIGYFGEHSNGNLILIVSNKSGLDLLVYEMDRRLEGRHWVLKHHIDPIKELNKFPEMCQTLTRSKFAVIWVGEDDEKNITFVLSVSKKAILYNHNKKEIKVICDLPVCEALYFGTAFWEAAYLEVTPFIGSFCAV